MGGTSSIFNMEKGFHDETMAKIFLVSLILLLFVLSFVVSLHLYSKWFLRHREQQQPPSSSVSATTTTTTVVLRLRRTDSSSGFRGLDVRVLRSIPVMVLEEGGSSNGSSTECAVCLCEVAKGDKYRLLPKCRHGFHVDCIDMWFASHATCPLCRDPVSVPGLTLVSKKPRSEVNLDAILETTRAENAAMFPTNVLFWGNRTQVSTRQLRATEEGTTGATSSATVAIDMPRQTTVEEDEELSGVVTTRFRSLKKMLSGDRKINPCSPNGDASTQS